MHAYSNLRGPPLPQGASMAHTFMLFWPKFDDFAITLGKANSRDQMGILFCTRSAAAFLAFTGAAPNPWVAPAIIAGNAAQVAQIMQDGKCFETQQACIDILRAYFLEVIPPSVLEPMEVNRSLRTRTLEYMINDIKERFGTLSRSDLDYFHTILVCAYVHPEDIDAFLAKKRTCLSDLALAGQPMAQSMAIDKIMSCFIAPDMTACWTKFVQDVPLVANQTVALLCAAISTYVKTVLPLMATRTSLQMNIAAEWRSEIDALKADNAALRLAFATNAAPFTPLAQKPVLRMPSRDNRPQRFFVSDGPTAKFCFIHGPCGHTSKECFICKAQQISPAETAATWKKQAGSKWRHWWECKEWSLQ